MAAKATTRSTPSKGGPKGESKQGLVVTLVFFILATIGLGVATYFGFAEQEDLTKAKEKAELTQKEEAKLIDFYKFQSILYYTYISTINGFKPEDLDAYDIMRSKIDDESILPKDNKYEKEKEDLKVVKKRMEDLEKMVFKDAAEKDLTLKFDKATRKPSNTFDEITIAQSKRYISLKERFDKVAIELKEAQDAEKKSQDELVAYKTKIDVDLKGITNTSVKEFDALRSDFVKQRQENDKNKKDLQNQLAERSKDKEDFEEKIVKLDKKIRDKDIDIANLAGQLSLTKTKGNEIGKNIRPDYKIVSIDRSGSLPYINIGTGDRVKPQDTFSIHGIGPDGKPLPEIKGTLEVINVVGEHLAQCRVLTVKNTNKDPILKGDVLFNPAWNPNVRRRIALMGIVDLTGDGKDQIYEFIAQMERQGVIIDAFLDPASFEIRNSPGISPKTDFLIVGDGINSVKDPRGMTPEKLDIFNKSIRKMYDNAKDNGVVSVDLRKFLEMSGYRVPKNYFESGPNPNAIFSNKPAPIKAGEKMKEEPAKEEAKKEEAKKEEK